MTNEKQGPQGAGGGQVNVNVVGMREFDELMDHIYEYGTASEGVIERANAFARAVIARYAPQQPADDEVVFVDGVGAGRSSIKSCHGGVQWIRVGDRVYWPLSESDAKRLQRACCGNGSFDGPTMPAVEGVNVEGVNNG